MKASPKISKTHKSVQAKSESLRGHTRTGTGSFTFRNGDNYEGGYRMDIDKHTLIKQDEGVYITDNFEVYSGKWSDDKLTGEFHIRYNNNAQYKGEIDANEEMSGTGTYIFPDDSTLTATWSGNKPVSDVVYKQPLGDAWTTTSISDNHVAFMTGNHFWNEICRVEESALEEGSLSEVDGTITNNV
ncbi:hypothetical protein HN011_007936 [Eciton burchellii]|nr:hypothetical protein HN011_007936 [Eciton burchellii]